MDLSALSDRDRLILGLRFRLKHIRLAIAEVDAGQVPEGFEFALSDPLHMMLAELRRLEHEVQQMLQDSGDNDGGALN